LGYKAGYKAKKMVIWVKIIENNQNLTSYPSLNGEGSWIVIAGLRFAPPAMTGICRNEDDCL